MEDEAAERRRGLAFGTAAYFMWGMFPLYFPLLRPAGTVEILASRMAWSLVVVIVLLQFGSGFRGVRAVLRDRRRFGTLTAAAVLISVNWGVYIYGVNSGHVVETSLGYFINPLFTIILGVVVLGERLRPAQWVAVGIGVVAVLVIAIDYGRPPWIALILAFSFGLYGFAKKQVGVGATDSLAIETGVLFVPAVVALIVVAAQGDLVFGTRLPTSLLLAGSGLVTAVPLIFFAAGASRLPLSIMGLLQYLTPSLQFAVGVGIRHESTPAAELAGFVLVWIALAVLSVDGLRHQRRRGSRMAEVEPVPG
ncbi:MAG TPA: EamA family transporter RarD [Jatrophihabitans sp.]|uniref:EamA family transporter RarD n=1 Tax=Jatrophihabitans sp. TaxID=1932789 RepID=UPI002DFAEF4C|nr:EamA family transporter RarD [Jatrophihabitans sp.]